MSHHPVPFDFVPFSANEPMIKTQGEWEKEGQLLSGSIRYKLNSLTPLHIVGKQERNGNTSNYQITCSWFTRSAGNPVIPGSSIKGMIRSFFEALTNSWVSQATDEFPHGDKRRIAFMSYDVPGRKLAYSSPKRTISCGPVIPKRLHPRIENEKMDLASFLFGIVIEGNDDNVVRSRFVFEDVAIELEPLDDRCVKLPDIPGKAFMGGPKPMMSNWWYFRPYAIARHTVGGRVLTDFIGKEYWGRKFYYHQYPQECVQWYRNSENWPHTIRKRGQEVSNYYEYPVETSVNSKKFEGRIYFERVPKSLLDLVIGILEPGNDIKHKLGYGRAFGMGSIDIEIKEILASPVETVFDQEAPYSCRPGIAADNAYVDEAAFKWLKRILSFDKLLTDNNFVFTYPPFDGENFKKTLPWSMIQKITNMGTDDNCLMNKKVAELIAKSLYGTKKTIHFRYYQKNSDFWSKIAAR